MIGFVIGYNFSINNTERKKWINLDFYQVLIL
jgi:hypothetical protein